MILEAAIGVCIHESVKVQYVNKGVVKRSLIGSSKWVTSTKSAEGNENAGYVMPTKFVNILETIKLRIRGQYLDSVSYVLLHFLTLQLYENLGPVM